VLRKIQEMLRHVEHRAAGSIVDYDVVFSISYQVPVLYVCVRGEDGQPVHDFKTMYDFVVPKPMTKALESIGIMGGVTLAVCAFVSIAKLR
jgi:ubiquitin-like-conjugating enzyme ATG10